MLPNFEPGTILRQISALMRAGDLLLLSANLAPGKGYMAGVRKVLPQYDNELTRDWLRTFLRDIGVDRASGELEFRIERGLSKDGARRVAAYFRFGRLTQLQVHGRRFQFRPGQSMRLFFSYRHTPVLVRKLARRHGLRLLAQWITSSEEEGVMLLERRSTKKLTQTGA